MQVNEKVVLLVDAASETGWQVAQQLAAAGAILVLHDEANSQTLKTYARNLHAQGHEPLPIIAELEDPKQRKALFERIVKIYGRLDIFVQTPLKSNSFLNLSPDALKKELSSLSARLHSLRLAASELARAQGGELLLLAESAPNAYLDVAYRRYSESIQAELSTRRVSVRALSLTELGLELNTQPSLTLAPKLPSPVRNWFGARRKAGAALTQVKEPS